MGRGGRRDGNFFLGGTDFDLVFCGGFRLGNGSGFGYGKRGRFGFWGGLGVGFGFGSGWGRGWFGLFRRGGLRGGILDFRFLIRNFGWRLRGGGLRRGGSGRWKAGAWAEGAEIDDLDGLNDRRFMARGERKSDEE